MQVPVFARRRLGAGKPISDDVMPLERWSAASAVLIWSGVSAVTWIALLGAATLL